MMNNIKEIYTRSTNQIYSLFTQKKLELIDSLKQRDLQNQDFKVSIEEEDMSAILKGGDKALKELKKKDKEKRNKLVLWKQPLKTIHYFLSECKVRFIEYVNNLLSSKWFVVLLLAFSLLYILSISVRGRHTEFIARWRKQTSYCLEWIGLGFLSSAGFGMGLHTFVLYLGPFIAKVTLAAYECQSVNFLTPPYPHEILCPNKKDAAMSIWKIIRKVRLESFMWGAGTAIGELPPYYLSRQSVLNGVDPDDEEYEEAASMLETDVNDNSLYCRAKLFMKSLVEKAGFFGILMAASIPNPLFDLAGITCGHFLVPFWTFFGATLIGKAVIKMHLQMFFVVFLFSEEYVSLLLSWIGYFYKF